MKYWVIRQHGAQEFEDAMNRKVAEGYKVISSGYCPPVVIKEPGFFDGRFSSDCWWAVMEKQQ